MSKIACKDTTEVSCFIGNILAELEQPCRMCQPGGAVVLTGRSPTGEAVSVRILPSLVLEVEGGEDLLEEIRKRRQCPYGR